MARLQIEPLARTEWAVEFDLELAGQLVAATLLTTKGVYAIVVHDHDPNDTGGIATLDRLVRNHERPLSELARLTGIEPGLVVYTPYADEAAQPAYIAGRVVTRVGRPMSLMTMLEQAEGPGLTVEAIELFRDAAKPYGRSSSPEIPLGAIGRDSPDLGNERVGLA